MEELLAALAWGLAEATVFFIVPDLLLSGLAIIDWRHALTACAAATIGALAGGAAMYHWGRRAPESAQAFLLRIPGISTPMLARVRDEVASRRLLAVLTGPLSGTPYKCYAVEAGRQGLPFAAFVLISVPARLARFLLATGLTAWLAWVMFPGMNRTSQFAVWVAAWTVFYVWYFRAMRTRPEQP